MSNEIKNPGVSLVYVPEIVSLSEFSEDADRIIEKMGTPSQRTTWGMRAFAMEEEMVARGASTAEIQQAILNIPVVTDADVKTETLKLPTMSDMESHTVSSNEKITVTVRRISNTEYLQTDVFNGETTETKLNKYDMLTLFSSPHGFHYKTKWADFPEIRTLACEMGE